MDTMPKRQELGDDASNKKSKCGSPEKAMEEIQKQETHYLYCPKCTCNITKTARLFAKGDEVSPLNQKSFVLWIALFIPFKFLSSSPTGPVERTLSNPNKCVTVEKNSSNPNQCGPVKNNSSDPNSNGPVDNISSNPDSNGPVENNASKSHSSGPIDNISSNPNSNGPVKNNSSNPHSSGSLDNNSSNPSLSHFAKFLERLPSLYRTSIVRREENNVTNKENDNSADHQSSTSTAGTMKTPGKHAEESEKRKHVDTHGDGWLYHTH